MVHVDELVAGLQRIPAEGFTLDGVEAYLQGHPVEPGSLAPYLHWAPTHYTRNLVFKCERFEVIVICWERGQGSRIHNHAGQDCWMTVPIGRLAVQNYEVVEEDLARGFCRLRPANRLEMTPARPARVERELPVHAVLNLPEYAERAASVHLYARPYDRCLVYQLETDSVCEVPLFYDTEYGRPVPA